MAGPYIPVGRAMFQATCRMLSSSYANEVALGKILELVEPFPEHIRTLIGVFENWLHGWVAQCGRLSFSLFSEVGAHVCQDDCSRVHLPNQSHLTFVRTSAEAIA